MRLAQAATLAVLLFPSRASSLCCHLALALGGWVGPVGRWSLSGVVLAARQTARSPSRSAAGSDRPGGHQGGVFGVLVASCRTSVASVVRRSDRAVRYAPRAVRRGADGGCRVARGTDRSRPFRGRAGASRGRRRGRQRVQLTRSGYEVERGEGFCAGGGEQDEAGSEGWPGGVVADAWDDPVGTGLEANDGGGAEVVFGPFTLVPHGSRVMGAKAVSACLVAVAATAAAFAVGALGTSLVPRWRAPPRSGTSPAAKSATSRWAPSRCWWSRFTLGALIHNSAGAVVAHLSLRLRRPGAGRVPRAPRVVP